MFKYISKAGEWAKKSWSKLGKAAGGTGKTKRSASILSRVWRGIDVAFTGLLAYDYFFNSDKLAEGGSRSSNPVEDPTSLLGIVMNRASLAAVVTDYPDYNAVVNAFANQAVYFLGSPKEGRQLLGLVYAATAQYIEQYPDPEQVGHSAEEIVDVLGAVSFAHDDNDETQTEEAEEQRLEAAKEWDNEMKTLREEVKTGIENDPASIRVWDFVTFVVRFLDESLGGDLSLQDEYRKATIASMAK